MDHDEQKRKELIREKSTERKRQQRAIAKKEKEKRDRHNERRRLKRQADRKAAAAAAALLPDHGFNTPQVVESSNDATDLQQMTKDLIGMKGKKRDCIDSVQKNVRRLLESNKQQREDSLSALRYQQNQQRRDLLDLIGRQEAAQQHDLQIQNDWAQQQLDAANDAIFDQETLITMTKEKMNHCTNSEQHRRKMLLKNSQNADLADTLATNSTSSSVAVSTFGLKDSSAASQTSVEDDVSSLKPAAFFATSAPPKSILKSSSYEHAAQSLVSRLMDGASPKKQRRTVSFGPNETKEFHFQPGEDRSHVPFPIGPNLHGEFHDAEQEYEGGLPAVWDYQYEPFYVSVANKVEFREWIKKPDEEFLRDFTIDVVHEMEPAIVLQTLQAADRSKLIPKLKCTEILRPAAIKAFPSNKFRKREDLCRDHVLALLKAARANAANAENWCVTENELLCKRHYNQGIAGYGESNDACDYGVVIDIDI